MGPKVAIIILNFNGWRDTIECLESVYRISYDNYDVICVDNASHDASLEMINEYCKGALRVDSSFIAYSEDNKPIEIRVCNEDGELIENTMPRPSLGVPNAHKLTLIKCSTNYGFAEGNNIAIRYALRHMEPEHVLLLNNDTVVDKEFVAELVEVAKCDNKIGLVQSKIVRYADLRLENAGMCCDILGGTRFRGWKEADSGQYDHLTSEFFYACGTSLLINTNLVNALSGDCFDKRFFAYHEDLDLSWRARLLGFSILFSSKSVCYHKQGGTSGAVRSKKAFWDQRNRLLVVLKNHSIEMLAVTLPIILVLRPLVLAMSAVHIRDFTHLRAFFRGLVWNVVNMRSTVEMRRQTHVIRRANNEKALKYLEHGSIELSETVKGFYLILRTLSEIFSHV